MSVKICFLALSLSMSLVGSVRSEVAHAQKASTTSLVDHLKAQYKVTKIVPDSNGYKIVEPGTMLVIQKEGIVGVPLGSNSLEPVIYAIEKDTDLHHSTVGPNSWKFEVGHKVYLSKLDIDAKHEKVLLTIVERESSNPSKPAYYKSVVDFEFPNGYLAGAEVEQIEDVIQQILTIDNGTSDVQQQVHGGPNLSTSLTNDDIIKLVQAKLPDSVILAKIRSSSCEFDTDPDALIKLKKAGVSEAVLQAILDAQSSPAVSGESLPTNDPGGKADAMPACGSYDNCIKIAKGLIESSQWDRALARLQEASELDAARGDAWAGIGYVYFQTGQYEDAFPMWDKALQLGSTLSISACHAKAMCGDTGVFSLNMKEISFVNKKGEKELAATPSDVTSEGAVMFNNGQAYYLQLRIAGKNYRFYYLPKGMGCAMGFVCPEPGATQQKIFGDYTHQTLVRIASGDFGSQPAKR